METLRNTNTGNYTLISFLCWNGVHILKRIKTALPLFCSLCATFISCIVGAVYWWSSTDYTDIVLASLLAGAGACAAYWLIDCLAGGRGMTIWLVVADLIFSWDIGVAMASTLYKGKDTAYGNMGMILWSASVTVASGICVYNAAIRQRGMRAINISRAVMCWFLTMTSAAGLGLMEGKLSVAIRMIAIVSLWACLRLSTRAILTGGKGRFFEDSMAIAKWREELVGSYFISEDEAQTVSFDNALEWSPAVRRALKNRIEQRPAYRETEIKNVVLGAFGLVPAWAAVEAFTFLNGAGMAVTLFLSMLLGLSCMSAQYFSDRYWDRLQWCKEEIEAESDRLK
ncbi:putative membrane protein [Bifidobacterium saguini DSM 23967]|uniref:Putative membrane protein n=2 Tax=Bifidobacterium saguini TaxID=762210 RepID=A0A087D6W1_9BIFI|nr:putative membrane protein [Bifidobacterium saguini DSM 23967]